MSNKLTDFSALFVASLDDVEAFSTGLATQDNLTTRRAYVRAVFALVEGVTFAMKQVALDGPQLASHPGELALFREESYSLDQSGRLVVRPAQLTMLPNLRYAFAAFSAAYGTEYSPDLSARGWASLRDALEVRHRLMHPKSAAQLTVSDIDIDNVRVGFQWFVSNVALLLRATVLQLQGAVGEQAEAVVPPVDLDRIGRFYTPYSK